MCRARSAAEGPLHEHAVHDERERDACDADRTPIPLRHFLPSREKNI